MTVVINQTEARKVIAYTVQGNGTLLPTALTPGAGPTILPVNASPIVIYTENLDGTLSPDELP